MEDLKKNGRPGPLNVWVGRKKKARSCKKNKKFYNETKSKLGCTCSICCDDWHATVTGCNQFLPKL
jgi:hypothetical protein